MTVDLAALAKLASEATPGPWTLLDDGWVWGPPSDDGIRDPICETLSDIHEVDSDAAYIAAASPDVVAALVRVALAAKELIDWDDGRHYGQEPPLDDIRAALEALR